MRRRAAPLIVAGSVALLLVAPRAPGLPDVPGDPTPPVVTPVITGTLGSAGWYTSNVTVNWSVSDPESLILSTTGCNATTLTSNTAGTPLSCTAESDGGTTTIGKTFKVDKTPPAANASPSRNADVNGWYNKPLSVSFAATDGMSGVDSCSGSVDYAGPDTTGTPVAGTCRDVAGNTSSASETVKYDATSPSASASARAADSNGWFNHAVTVTFVGADGTSGVGTCTQQTYAGPDDSSVALTGTCTDNAGNVSPSRSFTLKYDETAPTASATPSRAADVNGWHNHALTVSFSGDDATSGLESCDAPKSYSGPDSATAAVGGACRDWAGNVAPRSFAFKYDGTAPTVTATPARAANANGWYSAPIGVTFTGTDPVASVATCSASKTYSGPDNASAEVTGSCTDAAGNVGNKALPVKYDATAPQATATPARAAGPTGWYVAPLAVGFTATDPTSGVDTCDVDKTYSGPDSASATVGGACRDKAGNSGSASLPLKYDATKPAVTASASRPAGTNGWYSAPLTVGFTGSDATSGVDTCDADKTYAGPDAVSTAVTGSCRDKAGNSQNGQLALKYDATAPQVTASASRVADANGWYNHALSVSFGGTDPTAGIDTCDAAKSYSGPDGAAASVTGSCRDKAGNTASAPLGLKYDATAPALTGITPSRPPDADQWYNRALSVQFQGADGMSGVESCTQVNYGGPDNVAASVSGSCGDKAGNRTASSAFAFKYDATAPAVTATPERVADANGWYNHALSVSFAGADATSDIRNCDAAKTYSGPDAASTSVPGSCRDNAGNVGTGSAAVKYDATNPTASATPSRAANANGWYGAPLTVSFTGADALSGLDFCDAAKSYSGPDRATATVGGACKDKAGNTQTASFGLNYDATAPQVTASASRAADANGWYNHGLSVAFAGTDVTAGVDSCDAAKPYSGPDTVAVTLTGSCRDKAGNAASAPLTLKYDATKPTAAPTASRAPDANGWFNHPVAVTYAGSDATSGVDTCTQQTYAGPDNAAVSIDGTCKDKAGNLSASGSFGLKYDATAPATTASPSRAAGSNGWYNAPLSVSFSGPDVTSGLDSCDAAKSYAGPDSASASVGGACRDKAGNSASATLPLKYDATAPGVTATPARPPGTNGWYRAPVGVTFTGADAMSGPDTCDAAKAYSGPDSASTAVAGNCRDKAGNSGTGSFGLKYDATAPQVTASTSRVADSNGWFNHPLSVSFTATDDTAGVDTCDAAKPYGGPDSTGAPVSGTCTDKAGNTRTVARTVKYDATAPVADAVPAREPDANGWYNHAVAVGFGGSDSTSGIAACSNAQTYEGPDTPSVSLSGSCSDQAGNPSAPDSIAIQYDATAPQILDSGAVRPPDRAGWYNRPIAFAIVASDVTSGIASCPNVTYAGPDDGSASFAASCADRAGNRGIRQMPLRYDATAPATAARPDRAPDSNGWYNHAFAVSFAGEDGISGLESCSPPESYAGPDSEVVEVGGVCTDRAGNVGLASVTAGYDATAPAVTAHADRPPDANGWYSRPLVVAFHGADATSQIEGCTQASYGGPDASAGSVSGSCRDRAGNSNASSFGLRYDSTAPALGQVGAKAGNATATLTWAASPDIAVVRVRRGETVVYTGAGTTFTDKGLDNGVLYRYTVTAYDEAENAASSSVTVRPSGPLLQPAANAVVSGPPRLAWKPVPKATYYNVQLWRRGRILSLWPARASLQLPRRWKYNGRRYRLTDGRYRWYVFPGYGRRSEHRFGKRLGSSSFIVR